MQRMEALTEQTSLPSPNPERPLVHPNIVTISSPELEHLPYRVEIDPAKLGDFMRTLGMKDNQINGTTLTIAYDARGLAKLAGGLDPLGYVNPFTGNLTINAHTIMKRAELTNQRFQKELAQGATQDMVEAEILSRRLARTLMGQIFPELLEKGQSDSLRNVSTIWRTTYANLSREKGQETRAKAFMEKHLTRVIDHNLRLVLPHELIHVDQVKSGRFWPMTFRTIPIVMSWFALNLTISHGLRMIRNIIPAARKFPIKTLMGITEFGLQSWLYLRTLREGRKATGIEKEAYERMKDYDDLFTDIIHLVPVGEATQKIDTSSLTQSG